ncbi:YueI family protein [Bacillus massiliglaciei]|uniref:YueI family protein n=1 Tax=Bacillus massiliglaciei TaxID=1816693 RepID=UPI000DA61AAA|nr:YueI family protein [Bacillus massiliglaciei]
MANKVEDYLEQGIYGKKEINPKERRLYLGTLRERVIAAVHQSEIFKGLLLQEILAAKKEYPRCKMLLNGNIPYQYLGKYIKAANQYNLPYKMVLNKDYNSEYGLILTGEEAINKEEIHIKVPVSEPKEINEKKKITFSMGLMIKKVLRRAVKLFRK